MELMVQPMSEALRGRVRMSEPMRRQGIIRFEMPEDTLPEDQRLFRVLALLREVGSDPSAGVVAMSVFGVSLLAVAERTSG